MAIRLWSRNREKADRVGFWWTGEKVAGDYVGQGGGSQVREGCVGNGEEFEFYFLGNGKQCIKYMFSSTSKLSLL